MAALSFAVQAAVALTYHLHVPQWSAQQFVHKWAPRYHNNIVHAADVDTYKRLNRAVQDPRCKGGVIQMHNGQASLYVLHSLKNDERVVAQIGWSSHRPHDRLCAVSKMLAWVRSHNVTINI